MLRRFTGGNVGESVGELARKLGGVDTVLSWVYRSIHGASCTALRPAVTATGAVFGSTTHNGSSTERHTHRRLARVVRAERSDRRETIDVMTAQRPHPRA